MTEAGNHGSALDSDETDSRTTRSGKRAVVYLLSGVLIVIVCLGALIGFVIPPGNARIDLFVFRFQPSVGWLALFGAGSVGLLTLALVLYSSIASRYEMP